jgi:hypothetical protein
MTDSRTSADGYPSGMYTSPIERETLSMSSLVTMLNRGLEGLKRHSCPLFSLNSLVKKKTKNEGKGERSYSHCLHNNTVYLSRVYIYAYSVCTAAFIYGCVSKWEKTFGFTWLICRYRGGRVGLVMQQTRDMPLGSQKIPGKKKRIQYSSWRPAPIFFPTDFLYRFILLLYTQTHKKRMNFVPFFE